jgi:hypothetical protein
MSALKIKKISFCLLILLISSACSKSEQANGQTESSAPIVSETTLKTESKTTSTTQPNIPDLPIYLGQEEIARVQDSPDIKKLKTAALQALSVQDKKDYVKIGFDLVIYDIFLNIERNQPELKGNMAKAKSELEKHPDYAPDRKIENVSLTSDQQLVQAHHNAQLDLNQIQATNKTITPILSNKTLHQNIDFNSCITMLDLFLDTVDFERKTLYTAFLKGESFSRGTRNSGKAPPMVSSFHAMKKKCTQATNLITIAIHKNVSVKEEPTREIRNSDSIGHSRKQLLEKNCALESNNQIENGVDRYLCPSEVLLALRTITNSNLERKD